MNDERFENRLCEQPLRPIPPAWRGEILSAASAATPARSGREAAGAQPWWRALLWPNPVAWAGVAAAWLLIVGLNYLTPGPTSTVAVSRGIRGFDLEGALVMQRWLVTDQIENRESHESKPATPSPRQRPRSSRVAPQKTFGV